MCFVKPIALAATLLLAACTPKPVSGSADSGVRLLQVGMTQQDVAAILGDSPLATWTSDAPDQQCTSYVYDETIGAKYVHVIYKDGRLVTATDRHKAPC
ncbi:outer membrane protein assembly factor BamE [Yoonia sp. F2084L]|uniref:outer membrane protein assembly factor BamE domain-containing protein n=1 Tax=Yoonia sp. F2084L TaxID=2926419 RepID=UPI001FF6E2D0|nr:outer membrane protein assembly factor BamE [Yoonia sp. F2084L]MCK0094318.1 outer membrane protein assembly factor BamE [Yoonia sp. F2084L]